MDASHSAAGGVESGRLAGRVDSADDRPRHPPRGHPLHRGHPGRLPDAATTSPTDRSRRRSSSRSSSGRPLLLEGEAGVGKTELAKVLAASLGTTPHPPPVLRGARRQHGRLRVELPAPDARDPAARGARRGRAGDRARHLRGRLPHPPAAPPGARVDRRRRAGPAHRRDRPGRRGVRGVPARDPVRLPGHGPRDRHDQGRDAAAGDPDLEPDARGPRRAQAPLPLPLDRLPDRPEGIRDRPRQGPRGAGAARPRGRRLRPSPARGRPDQGARASPRRSTGPPRSCRSVPASSRPSSSTRRSASSSSTRRTSARSAARARAATWPRPAPAADRPRTTRRDRPRHRPLPVRRPRSTAGACSARRSGSGARCGRLACRSTSAPRSTSRAP